MIQTGITATGIINYIQKKLSVIIIVPAFIGGLWQALELLNISTPFLRFFSISQIVPDGLLILIIFLIPFIVPVSTHYFDKLFFTEDYTKEKVRKETREKLDKSPKGNLILFTIVFIMVYGSGLYYFYRIIFETHSIDNITLAVMMTYLSVYASNIFLTICYELATSKFRVYYKFCNIFLLVLYLLIGYSFAKEVHNKFLLNDKLDNIENIYSALEKTHPKTKKRILYFNDKYIFVEIISTDKKTKKSAEKIHIMELDNLFTE